jgi:DNA polymerase
VAVKSSIDSTRAKAFIDIARAMSGWLPVPLLYYGAHTGRAAGMMGINMQNLPKKSGIRKALVAPKGYSFIVADLSQIEARITAVLAGQWDLVEEFSGDPYSAFATEIYKIPVSRDNPDTVQERFVGKTCILGLGYGMSAAKLHLTLTSAGVDISLEECGVIVRLYRRKYSKIPALWRSFDQLLFSMTNLGAGQQEFGPLKVMPLGFELPNGMRINYPGLHRDAEGFSFTSWDNPNSSSRKRIWGGGATENVVQALARIIISRAELRLARAGLQSVLQVHDELVYVVPDAAVERAKTAVRMALVDPVPWMPRLPIACEVGSGKSYGQAK